MFNCTLFDIMPVKSGRQRKAEMDLKHARKKKLQQAATSNTAVDDVDCEDVSVLTMSQDALDTINEAVGADFDFNSSSRSDTDHLIDAFEDWVAGLDHDNKMSLGYIFSLSSS